MWLKETNFSQFTLLLNRRPWLCFCIYYRATIREESEVLLKKHLFMSKSNTPLSLRISQGSLFVLYNIKETLFMKEHLN